MIKYQPLSISIKKHTSQWDLCFADSAFSIIRCELNFVGIFVREQDQVWSHLCWHLCLQARSGVISSLLASLFASKIRCDLIFVGIFVCKQDQVWSHLCWHLCSQATSGVSSSLLALLPPVISLMERLQLSPAAAGGDKRNYLRQHSFEKKNPNLYSSPVISKWLQIWQNKYHQTNSPQIVLLLKIGLICPCKSRHRSFSVKMQHLAVSYFCFQKHSAFAFIIACCHSHLHGALLCDHSDQSHQVEDKQQNARWKEQVSEIFLV